MVSWMGNHGHLTKLAPSPLSDLFDVKVTFLSFVTLEHDTHNSAT